MESHSREEGILKSSRKRKLKPYMLKLIPNVEKKFLIGSLHRAPNTQSSEFTAHIQDTTDQIKCERGDKQIIMCMDHSLDLIKSNVHKGTCVLLDSFLDRNILPAITRPTRITQTSATLIDNVFISEKLHCTFGLAVLLSDISDHLPSLVLLKQTKLLNKEPLEFESRTLNKNR